MSEKDLDMFKKIIEAKKEKSAQQGVGKRAPNVLGSSRAPHKKHKKGGLFDK